MNKLVLSTVNNDGSNNEVFNHGDGDHHDDNDDDDDEYERCSV